MGLFGNLFGGQGRNPFPRPQTIPHGDLGPDWPGSGNAPYMVGQPSDYSMPGTAPGGFGAVQPHQGRDWGRTLETFLTTLSASQGDPAALSRIHLMAEQQRQEREHQQSVNDTRGNFLFEQQYRAAHPPEHEPTELERYMVSAGIDPHSPQGQAMFRDAANNRANPMVAVQTSDAQGQPAIRYIRPSQTGPTGAPPVLTDADIAAHRSQGGAGPAAAPGGFPRRW